MPFFSSPVDSTTLFYRYYQPDEIAFRPLDRKTSDITLVFLHGWPMSSRMFEHLLLPLCETYRFRCIAPDRRGFGKSEWNTEKTSCISFDTFVADLVGLLEHLDVKDFVLVGASMGTQESVLAYLQSPFIRERCKVRKVSVARVSKLADRSLRGSSGWARTCPFPFRYVTLQICSYPIAAYRSLLGTRVRKAGSALCSPL